MSGSDLIKAALVAQFPGSLEKEWKRRSKIKTDRGIERKFDHQNYGEVVVLELPDGNIVIDTPAPTGSDDSNLGITVSAAMTPVAKTLTASDLNKGDRITIPKGSVIYEFSYDPSEFGGSNPEPAKRAITATVSGTAVVKKNWLTLAPAEYITRIENLMQSLGTTGRRMYMSRYLLGWLKREADEAKGVTRFSGNYSSIRYSGNLELGQLLKEAKAATDAVFGGDYTFVLWSDGKKGTHISNVQMAQGAAVTPKVPKEQTITKRRLMVPKSKWRFTREVTLEMWVENPEIARHLRLRDAQPRSPNHALGQYGSGPIADQHQQEIHRLLRDEPMVKIAGTVSAGTEFEIVDKLAAGYVSYGQKNTNGLLVPIEITKGAIDNPNIRTRGYNGGLPYKQIEDAVEPLEVPETIVWTIRDSKTGEFFGGWQDAPDQYGHNRSSNTPKLSKTFSGAKKYKNLSALKASIRDFTGYNDGLNDEGEYVPEWASGGQKKIDLPETWEAVSIDKTTNAEKEVVDVQNWFKELNRLRVLTQKQCSAVRTTYKKAMEKGGFEAILLFQNRYANTVTYRNGNSIHYDEATPFEDEPDEGKAAIAAITAAIGHMGGKSLRTKTQSAIAVACSVEDGLTAKLMFNYPGVIIKFLDINNLEEIVDKQVTTA